MNYIRITKENIDKEHICCAMSGKPELREKEWLTQGLAMMKNAFLGVSTKSFCYRFV